MAQGNVRPLRDEETLAEVLGLLVTNVERVVTGKRRIVELAVVALASGGHLLLEDVPGVGKTVLARALARSVEATFSRVQGAPDLLPSDVTGTTVFDQSRGGFTFVAGPLFANVVLVDELNRTTPRTQAALLESMEEGQVTVDGVSHQLPRPHFVVATQNPLEHHGTFPLPESQLDRFALATSVGYPTTADEARIVRAQVRRHPLEDLQPVVSTADIARIQERVREVQVSHALVSYAVRLVDASRDHPEVQLGASPRASIQLVHAAQALAALRGRSFALPDDVKALAPAALPHRLLLRGAEDDLHARIALVSQLLRSVPVDEELVP
ncbi:MAG: AAA family ATPase [Nitriliruptorales bacterium]